MDSHENIISNSNTNFIHWFGDFYERYVLMSFINDYFSVELGVSLLYEVGPKNFFLFNPLPSAYPTWYAYLGALNMVKWGVSEQGVTSRLETSR